MPSNTTPVVPPSIAQQAQEGLAMADQAAKAAEILRKQQRAAQARALWLRHSSIHESRRSLEPRVAEAVAGLEYLNTQLGGNIEYRQFRNDETIELMKNNSPCALIITSIRSDTNTQYPMVLRGDDGRRTIVSKMYGLAVSESGIKLMEIRHHDEQLKESGDYGSQMYSLYSCFSGAKTIACTEPVLQCLAKDAKIHLRDARFREITEEHYDLFVPENRKKESDVTVEGIISKLEEKRAYCDHSGNLRLAIRDTDCLRDMDCLSIPDRARVLKVPGNIRILVHDYPQNAVAIVRLISGLPLLDRHQVLTKPAQDALSEQRQGRAVKTMLADNLKFAQRLGIELPELVKVEAPVAAPIPVPESLPPVPPQPSRLWEQGPSLLWSEPGRQGGEPSVQAQRSKPRLSFLSRGGSTPSQMRKN